MAIYASCGCAVEQLDQLWHMVRIEQEWDFDSELYDEIAISGMFCRACATRDWFSLQSA